MSLRDILSLPKMLFLRQGVLVQVCREGSLFQQVEVLSR